MSIELLLAAVGITVTVGSLVFAVNTNREKARLEKLVRSKLAGVAGNILAIRKSTHWSYSNFQIVQQNAENLETSEPVNLIRKHAHFGSGDSASADRMLGNLLNEVLSLQRGMFEREETRHPDDWVTKEDPESR